MEAGEGAKEREEIKSREWLTIGCTYLFLFGAISLPIAFCVLAIVIPQLKRATFCSTSHEIYQFIADGELLWIQSLDEIVNPTFNIELSNGHSYTVFINAASPPGSRSYIIPVERSHADYQGAWGFYYDPTGTPYINELYHVEHLANDVYCYWYA